MQRNHSILYVHCTCNGNTQLQRNCCLWQVVGVQPFASCDVKTTCFSDLQVLLLLSPWPVSLQVTAWHLSFALALIGVSGESCEASSNKVCPEGSALARRQKRMPARARCVWSKSELARQTCSERLEVLGVLVTVPSRLNSARHICLNDMSVHTGQCCAAMHSVAVTTVCLSQWHILSVMKPDMSVAG